MSTRYMRNTTLGKLDNASTKPLDFETAHNIAMKKLQKTRNKHLVYGHSKMNKDGSTTINRVYYKPVKFSRKQYRQLVNALLDEYNSGVSNYYIFAEHNGTSEQKGAAI